MARSDYNYNVGLGGLLIIAEGSVVAPFIYTLFNIES